MNDNSKLLLFLLIRYTKNHFYVILSNSSVRLQIHCTVKIQCVNDNKTHTNTTE